MSNNSLDEFQPDEGKPIESKIQKVKDNEQRINRTIAIGLLIFLAAFVVVMLRECSRSSIL